MRFRGIVLTVLLTGSVGVPIALAGGGDTKKDGLDIQLSVQAYERGRGDEPGKIPKDYKDRIEESLPKGSIIELILVDSDAAYSAPRDKAMELASLIEERWYGMFVTVQPDASSLTAQAGEARADAAISVRLLMVAVVSVPEKKDLYSAISVQYTIHRRVGDQLRKLRTEVLTVLQSQPIGDLGAPIPVGGEVADELREAFLTALLASGGRRKLRVDGKEAIQVMISNRLEMEVSGIVIRVPLTLGEDVTAESNVTISPGKTENVTFVLDKLDVERASIRWNELVITEAQFGGVASEDSSGKALPMDDDTRGEPLPVPQGKATFVRGLKDGLPHKFPEPFGRGVWISSIPNGIAVFIFPEGDNLTFDAFKAWLADEDSCPNYLGQTPLHVDLEKGRYTLQYLHLPITDPNYKQRSVKVPTGGPMGKGYSRPAFPFIAANMDTIFAVEGKYSWTQKRLVDYEGRPDSYIALFQRFDQPASAMLEEMPNERNFKFDIEKLKNLSDYDLAHKSLSEEELREALEMLERGGVWGKQFGRAHWLQVEVLPEGSKFISHDSSDGVPPLPIADDPKNADDPAPSPKPEASKAKSWLTLAKNYANNGMVDKAKDYFNKVIETYPDTPEAREAERRLEALE